MRTFLIDYTTNPYHAFCIFVYSRYEYIGYLSYKFDVYEQYWRYHDHNNNNMLLFGQQANTETEMLSYGRNFRHWLHFKLS